MVSLFLAFQVKFSGVQRPWHKLKERKNWSCSPTLAAKRLNYLLLLFGVQCVNGNQNAGRPIFCDALALINGRNCKLKLSPDCRCFSVKLPVGNKIKTGYAT